LVVANLQFIHICLSKHIYLIIRIQSNKEIKSC